MFYLCLRCPLDHLQKICERLNLAASTNGGTAWSVSVNPPALTTHCDFHALQGRQVRYRPDDQLSGILESR